MKKSNRGFTLIEVVAALIILGIVGFPLVQFFTSSYKFQSKGQEKTEVNKVAQYVAEKLKNGEYFGIDRFEVKEEPYSIGIIKSTQVKGITGEYNVGIEIIGISTELATIGTDTPDFTGNSHNQIVYDELGNNVPFIKNDLDITLADGIFSIEKKSDTDYNEHNLLVENKSGTAMSFKIKNLMGTGEKLKVYRRGNISAIQGMPVFDDSGAFQHESVFENFNLGDKESVKSTNQNIYTCIIHVKRVGDTSISTDMETTFGKSV